MIIKHDCFRSTERYFIKSLYNTYTDVLFILFPFLLIALLRSWNDEGIEILKQPDLSIATAILAGISLGKLIRALISDEKLSRYKAIFALMFALILSLLLGPALLNIIKTINDQEVPEAIAIIQPLLLISAIALYSVSANISLIMKEFKSPHSFK